MADTTSWLDYVPGARTAYNYIVEKISEFNLIGLKQIPNVQSFLTMIAPRVQSSGDSNLIAQLGLVRDETNNLQRNWSSVDEKIRSFGSQTKAAGLGIVPVATIIAVATLAITVAGAMYLFFKRAENHEAMVADFVQDSVNRGLISAEEAARILKGDGGGLFGNLGSGLALVAIAAAAIYFIPRPRRKS